MSETYVCANCQGTFDKGWTDEEAKAEYEKGFGVEFSEDNTDIVCDTCYKEMQAFIEKRDAEMSRRQKEYDDRIAALSPTARMIWEIAQRAATQSIVNDIIGVEPAEPSEEMKTRLAEYYQKAKEI